MSKTPGTRNSWPVEDHFDHPSSNALTSPECLYLASGHSCPSHALHLEGSSPEIYSAFYKHPKKPQIIVDLHSFKTFSIALVVLPSPCKYFYHSSSPNPKTHMGTSGYSQILSFLPFLLFSVPYDLHFFSRTGSRK